MLWLIISSTHGLLWNFANSLKMSLLLMHLIELVPLILSILFYVPVSAICHEYVFFYLKKKLYFDYFIREEKKSMIAYNTQYKTIES